MVYTLLFPGVPSLCLLYLLNLGVALVIELYSFIERLAVFTDTVMLKSSAGI